MLNWMVPVHIQPVQSQHDHVRDAWLRRQKIYILRFKNDEVLFNRDIVLKRIQGVCESLIKIKHLSADTQPTQSLPYEGRRFNLFLSITSFMKTAIRTCLISLP